MKNAILLTKPLGFKPAEIPKGKEIIKEINNAKPAKVCKVTFQVLSQIPQPFLHPCLR